MLRSAVVGLALVAMVAAGSLLVAGSGSSGTDEAQGAGDDIVQATCSSAARGRTAGVSPRHDAVLGPLVLLVARRTPFQRREAFGGTGWKMPATLPRGVAATLWVPRAARSRIGLVYSTESPLAPARDAAVRFTACPADGRGGRTGWPGGIVVDRRRCATLIVQVDGEKPVRHRVPLGRRC